jgi:hypothetical protein
VTDLEFPVELKREILSQMMKMVYLSLMMGKLVIEIGDSHVVNDIEAGMVVLQEIYEACCVAEGTDDDEAGRFGELETFAQCIRTPFLSSKEQVSMATGFNSLIMIILSPLCRMRS